MPKKESLKVTKWFHPYTREKQWVKIGNKMAYSAPTSLKFTGSGVYLIKGKVAGKWKIIYVGMSAYDVKKTLYRHFQKWTDKRPKWNESRQVLDRVTYFDNFSNEDYQVKIIVTSTAEEAGALEEVLIKKISPRDNKAKWNSYENNYKQIAEKYKEAEEIKPSLEEVPF